MNDGDLESSIAKWDGVWLDVEEGIIAGCSMEIWVKGDFSWYATCFNYSSGLNWGGIGEIPEEEEGSPSPPDWGRGGFQFRRGRVWGTAINV